MTGTLFVVSTPIGNMGDMTFRAVEVLKKVDLVLSEDTRETRKVFDRYSINTPQIPYTDQKHSKLLPKLINLLDSGQSIALVSDSGTPLISDPGFKLINTLQLLEIDIRVVPGATSVTSALVVSGLPTDKFVFLGFLPKGKSSRKKILQRYGELDATLTIFESPYRVRRLAQEIYEVLGNRYVSFVKDLTKLHQRIITKPINDISIKEIMEKGEYVVLVAKEGYEPKYISTRKIPTIKGLEETQGRENAS